MSDITGMDKEQLKRRLYPLMVQQFKKGTGREFIKNRLLKAGFSEVEAEDMMNSAASEASATAPLSTKVTTPAAPRMVPAAMPGSAGIEPLVKPGLLPPLGAGLVAALIGGGIWGGLVIGTEHEFGIVAWGLGILCGFVVTVAAKGRKDPLIYALAIGSSLVGILFGKYLAFVYFARQYSAPAEEAKILNGISYFSPKSVFLFLLGLPSMLGLFDIIWVMLAVYFAWRMVHRTNVTVAPAMAMGESPEVPKSSGPPAIG